MQQDRFPKEFSHGELKGLVFNFKIKLQSNLKLVFQYHWKSASYLDSKQEMKF